MPRALGRYRGFSFRENNVWLAKEFARVVNVRQRKLANQTSHSELLSSYKNIFSLYKYNRMIFYQAWDWITSRETRYSLLEFLFLALELNPESQNHILY